MKVIFLLIFCPVLAFSQEYARVLDHSTTYDIYDNETAEVTEYYKVEIKSEHGYRFAIYQDYYDKFKKIEDVTINVFDKKGKKVKKLKRSDGMEFGFNPSNEITDAKILIIKPEYQQYPFTLEVTSRTRFNGFISLPSWIPRSHFHVAVNHSKLTVIRPVGVKINFKEEHIAGKTETSDGHLITKYEVANLSYVDDKIRYKDFHNDQPKVLISPERFKLNNVLGNNASWVDFGNWFLSLNNNPYTLTKQTMLFIDGLDKKDKKDLIRNIYEHMQDKSRYVSIQLGIGGFKSIPTEDVEKYGYGDCKALTTYMKNMLDYAGVKSNYILVRAGNDVPDVIADFPSSQFNHVFLGIPFTSDTVFLECTTQIAPFNYTGSFTDDRNILWVEQDKSSIIRSRVYNYEDNSQLNFVKIILDKAGNANAEFDVRNQGVFFDEFIMFKLAPSDYVKQYNQHKFSYPDFTIREFNYQQPHRNSAVFTSKYLLQINGLAKIAGDKLILQVIPTIPIHKYVDKDDLKQFCSIKRGITVRDEIEVDIPENYWTTNTPGVEEVNSRFGKYTIDVTLDNNRIKIKRTIVFFKGDYNSNRGFEEFKVFYQKIEKLESRKLILNSKT